MQANIKQLDIIVKAKDEASKQLAKISTQFVKMSKVSLNSNNSIIKGLTSFKSEAILLGGVTAGLTAGIAGLGVAMYKFGKNSLNTAIEFEQYNIAFSGMLGSTEKAGKLMNEIVESAKKTPFELDELMAGSKQLLAYNVEMEKIVPTLEMVGDITSTVGKDKLPILIRALGQVKAKTRLAGGELLQLTETGIPIIKELAKVTGYSESEIAGNTADLGISFEQVELALKSMTEEGGLAFKGMENQSKSLDGVVSNLKDNFTILGMNILGVSATGQIIKGEFFDTLKTAGEGMLRWVDANKESITTFANETLTNVADKIKKWWVEIGGAGGLQDKLTNLWATLQSDVIPAIASLIDWIKKITDFIFKHWKGVLTLIVAYESLKVALAIGSTVQATASALQFLTGTSATATTATRTLASSLTTGLLVALTAVTLYIMNEAVKAYEDLDKILEDVSNSIQNVKNNNNKLRDSLNDLSTESANKQLQKAINKADEMAESADRITERYEGMGGALKAVFDQVIDWSDNAWRSVKKTFSKISDAKKDGGDYKKRAVGGSVIAGQSYIVGERGQEVFTPSQNGMITPNGGGTTQNSNITINFNNPTVRNDNDLSEIIDTVKRALAFDDNLIDKGIAI